MNPARTIFRLLAPLVVAAIALTSCSALRPNAATVDGRAITSEQVDKVVAEFEFLLNQSPCGQPEEGETQVSACARLALGSLIGTSLLRDYATRSDIALSQDAIDEWISQVEAGYPDPNGLDQALAKHDLTRDDLEQLARYLLLYNEVQKAVGTEMVTDEDLRSYYEGHQLDYTQFHAEHILLETREEAEKIRREVTPDNFQELAKKHSIDPSARQTGGDLGNQPAVGSLDQTFVEAALSLKPGEIGQPVQTQFGWHIIHLISVDVVPFDRAKSPIRGQLSAAAFTTWLKDRFASAEITVSPKYGRFDPATGTVVAIRSTATTVP